MYDLHHLPRNFFQQLYSRFPNRPLEFQLATNKAPSFKISPGNIHVMLDVRANVVVDKADGSKLPVFYLDIVSHKNLLTITLIDDEEIFLLIFSIII